MSKTIVNPGCFKCKYLGKVSFDSGYGYRYTYSCKHESNLKTVNRPLKDVVVKMQYAEEKNKLRDCPYFEYKITEKVKLFLKGKRK